MNDYGKLAMSVLGSFVVGVTTAYNIDHTMPMFGLVMSGLTAIGPYLLGYWQRNPRNEPRSAEQLLGAVKESDLPGEVKARVAPVLASETITSTTEGADPP